MKHKDKQNGLNEYLNQIIEIKEINSEKIEIRKYFNKELSKTEKILKISENFDEFVDKIENLKNDEKNKVKF